MQKKFLNFAEKFLCSLEVVFSCSKWEMETHFPNEFLMKWPLNSYDGSAVSAQREEEAVSAVKEFLMTSHHFLLVYGEGDWFRFFFF